MDIIDLSLKERKSKMSAREQIRVSKEALEGQTHHIDLVRDRLVGRRPLYHIVTYGCQMNVHDSEKLAGMLKQMGYEETLSRDTADLILFNTCCVREHAELKVYGNIGALKALKHENPNMVIGVCGCMMQQQEVSETIVRKFPFVDLVFGTHNLHHFPALLLKALDSAHTVVEVLQGEGEVVENIPTHRAKGALAWVTVMYGCNNYCSYCIVPYVRGRERSREPQDIYDEIAALGLNGYKEVTLLGQNVNSYGKDLKESLLFPDLLRGIDEIDGIERVRFMTSHPKDLSLDLIRALAECSKLCEHLHLPIQSGSNRILREMNRRYTREDYLELVGKLRSSLPSIALTTDIIVGFPGETEEDFSQTLDIMARVQYDSAYTFMYSPRTGTPAAKIEDQIPSSIKKERLARLSALQASISKEKNMTYIDKEVEVLVEGPSKNKAGILAGRTRTNKPVHFSGDEALMGRLVKVRITCARSWTLEGELIS